MIEIDKDGVVRFKVNRIVRDVYDLHLDLNQIEKRYRNGDYTPEEKYEFLSLLGYSLEGWNELIYQDCTLFPDE